MLEIAMPPAPLLGAVSALWGALVAATGTVAVIARRRKDALADELVRRTRTWWWIAGLVTAALLLGPKASILFVALLSYLALKEFLSLVPIRRADRAVLFWAYLAIPVQFWFVLDPWYGMFSIFIPVYAFVLLAFRAVVAGETRGFIRAVGTLHWGLMLTVYNLSHLAFLLVLPLTKPAPAGGAGLLLFVLAVVQLNDVAQFVWGRLLGRRKVVPAVSPGKTWEGLLGGAATTGLIAALLAPVLTPFDLPSSIAIGLLLAVMGFVGDVTLSAVKRDLGIKDSGALLPGHGGVLDRLDSLTLTAPVFLHVVRYFYGA